MNCLKLDWKLKIIVAISLFIQINVLAQLDEIEFENYSTADGLASAWLMTPIVQDKDGYIWLLSLEGLNRFDGYEFKVYQNDPNDSTSLISANIRTLFVDSKKRFWIVSAYGSKDVLSLYNPESDNFKNYRSFHKSDGHDISFNLIGGLQEDKNGLFWFWEGNGIRCLDPESMEIKSSNEVNKLSHVLKNKIIDFFYNDSHRNFWFAVGNELTRYNPNLDSLDVFKLVGENTNSLDSNYISSVYEEKNGNLLFGCSNNLLNMYDPSLNMLVKLPTKYGKYKYLQPPISKGSFYVSQGIVSTIERTSNGNLWIGTINGGIKVYDKNLAKYKFYYQDPENNLNVGINSVVDLLEDSYQNIWLNTFNQGLLKIVPSKSLFMLQGNGLAALKEISSHSIRAIYESKNKTLWVGTSDGSILTYNPQNNKTKLYGKIVTDRSTISQPTGSDFQSFYEDPDGIMWIATLSGVNKFNPQNGVFSKAVFKINNQLIESTEDIENIIADKDDDIIWIGTWNKGLFKHNRKTLETTIYKGTSDTTSISDNASWTLMKTRSGDICAGTRNGLSIYNKSTDSFRNYFAGIAINTIYEDENGFLWLGTRQGLYKISPQKKIMKRFTTEDGFPSNLIGGILGDENNILWIGTGKGLVRLNPNDESFSVFDNEDGVLLDLYEPANSFCRTQDGLLLFGSSSGTGITAFYPSKIKFNNTPPNVLITNLSVYDNQTDTMKNLRVNGLNEIKLSYSQNDIIFNYVGIHFRNPKRNKYKYKLEPYDNDWKDAGTLRTARYTSLDPGKYIFRVIAANSDGVWSKKNASINISILPPWWETYWAYSFYVLFVIGILYSMRRFELNRQKKNLEIKESQLRAETAEFQAKAAEAQSRVIQAENDRKSQELEEARQLQLSMLPKGIPQLPNLDISVYMKTATEVGGDYYDFSTKEDGSLNICLGDATGHGMKAGALVSMMKSLFTANSINKNIDEFFISSNEALKNSRLEKMMMAFAMININTDKIKIANAGIPPIYIFRKNKNIVEEVNLNGLPIGAMYNSKYEIYESKLEAGDTILMLSDGFPEIQNDKNEMYGYDKLLSTYSNVSTKNTEEIINVFKNEVSNWANNKEPDDDITFVVIKVK